MALEVKTGLPGYYTLTEAAQELGYSSTSNFATAIRTGKIEEGKVAFKVGKTWLLKAEWVELEKGKEVSPIGNRGQARK